MTQKHYAVYHDENRHTCIRVDENAKFTFFIPFSVTELKIEKLPTNEFIKTYKALDDYSPQRAAERYVFNEDKVKIPCSPEAAAHLRLMAGPAFQRVDLRNDPAPNILPSTPKEPTVSKTEAPKKNAPAAKKSAPPAPAAKKAAPPAAKKAAPAAKKSADAESTRGRQPNISGDAKIKVLAAENPKRGGAAERFALYKNGMTVDEYLTAGGKRADVNWDVKMGFIEVK